MNNVRRKAIRDVMEELEGLKCRIDELCEEEREYMDNIPENLTGSVRYETADNAIYQMECAIDSMDEVIDNLTEIVEV